MKDSIAVEQHVRPFDKLWPIRIVFLVHVELLQMFATEAATTSCDDE